MAPHSKHLYIRDRVYFYRGSGTADYLLHFMNNGFEVTAISHLSIRTRDPLTPILLLFLHC